MAIKQALGVALCALAATGVSADPLLLTPLINEGKFSEARSAAQVNDPHFGMIGYSAFITVPSGSGKQNNNMYFYLQPCQDCAPDAPFLLWMQGGPGGPGTFGNFAEIGNHYVNEDLELKDRCFSWCKVNNCLFIDQPVQTGYSYSTNAEGKHDPKSIEYTKTSAEATLEVWLMLQQLYIVFPEYAASPFHITGESYGGIYTSYMGKTIVDQNKIIDSGGFHNDSYVKIDLEQILVGDPILNIQYQWPTYPDTLYGMGLVMMDEREELRGILAAAALKVAQGDCWGGFLGWNSIWNDDGGGGLPGLFAKYTGGDAPDNILLTEEPGKFDWHSAYLNLNTTANMWHYDGVPSSSFNEGGEVYHSMVHSGDFCTNASSIFADLFINHDIDLLIYSSSVDALLGPPTTEGGVQAMMDVIQKEYQAEGGQQVYDTWHAAKKQVWKVSAKDHDVAGFSKCFNKPNGKRFCYNVVKNGGHELPAYIPRASYDLAFRFIEGRSYGQDGDKDSALPQCLQCSGSGPFAGSAIRGCATTD